MNADALKQLRQTHAAGSQLLQRFNHAPENVEAVIEVEKHREYWKPKKPKLLLVAESHVYTTKLELTLRLDESKFMPFIKSNAAVLPNHFVRFVYCLAYGESELLCPNAPQVSNAGTPLYWDIFGQVASRCPQPRREAGADFKDRMKWKIDTLRELYRMGIWLLDASVHAIYRRGQSRLPLQIQQELHKQWWEGYGGYLLSTFESPKVWVIGKTVYDCLSALPFNNTRCRGWIYQPNATNVKLTRNWPQLLADCRQL